MLSRSSKTGLTSGSLSPENVHNLQDYISEQKSDSTPPSFQSLENENSEKEEKKNTPPENDVKDYQDSTFSELENLLPQKDFREILNRFFVAGHKSLFVIRSEIRTERGLNNDSFPFLPNIDVHNLQVLRKHYYQLQMVLFKTAKGQQYDISL